MNPMTFAKISGYSQEAILDYFKKMIPNFNSKLTQATAMGYTTDQVLKYFQKQFQGEKVDKRTSRYLQPVYEGEAGIGPRGKQPKRNKLGDGIVPLAGALGGAALGAATGGPVGAVRGAAGGYTSVKDVLNAYDNARAQGEDVGFSDFVKAAAKGVGSATLASTLYKLASEKGSDVETVSDTEDQTQKIQAEPQAESQEIKQLQVEKGLSPEDAFSSIESVGLAPLFTQLAQQVETPDQVITAFKSLNADLIKRLSPGDRGQGQNIVEKAFEYIKAGTQNKKEKAPEQEQIQEAEQELIAEKTDVKPLYIDPKTQSPTQDAQASTQEKEAIEKLLKGLPAKAKSRPITSKDVKPIQALRSSNVRGVTYHPDKTMQVVFDSGEAYQYPNVEREDLDKVLSGANTATTDGESVFRAFYSDKNPSIGSAFNEFIKKNSDKYPHEKIDKSEIRDTGLTAIRNADKVEKAAQYFEKFFDHTEKSKSKEQAVKVRELSQALKELPDDTQAEAIFLIRKHIRLENEKLKKAGKRGVRPTPKRIAKEIEKRLK